MSGRCETYLSTWRSQRRGSGWTPSKGWRGQRGAGNLAECGAALCAALAAARAATASRRLCQSAGRPPVYPPQILSLQLGHHAVVACGRHHRHLGGRDQNKKTEFSKTNVTNKRGYKQSLEGIGLGMLLAGRTDL